MLRASDGGKGFSVACHHCGRLVLDGVDRIDEDGVALLREHVLCCKFAPFAGTTAGESLAADRLRELGVLLKHFDVGFLTGTRERRDR